MAKLNIHQKPSDGSGSRRNRVEPTLSIWMPCFPTRSALRYSLVHPAFESVAHLAGVGQRTVFQERACVVRRRGGAAAYQLVGAGYYRTAAPSAYRRSETSTETAYTRLVGIAWNSRYVSCSFSSFPPDNHRPALSFPWQGSNRDPSSQAGKSTSSFHGCPCVALLVCMGGLPVSKNVMRAFPCRAVFLQAKKHREATAYLLSGAGYYRTVAPQRQSFKAVQSWQVSFITREV
ncbi:hypothetical protein BJ508DRAFT_381276 [Ascobolus immersus RN42]|uniref:Uncharacterized protein n=1 Tax=Ascobolus immersus RN42 TaxID=1160509 RepID=A0A3N4HFT2_ASCIM|nr:hypothetical protein BJ508DRAFT_381276 [Ascobolus immersus RN42]